MKATSKAEKRHSEQPVAVSAVILNWNGGDDLIQAVESLKRQTLSRVEVIVVDNASGDGSDQALEKAHPDVELIRLDRNTGFCEGNNIGLARTRGDWVLFLNCDAYLTDDYLEKLLSEAPKQGKFGFLTGKVLRFDGETIDTTGQFLTASRHVVERGYDTADDGQYDEPGEIPGICGAVALLSRELIDEIAPDGELFDPWFFAFSEDADVSWRAQLRGWRGWYSPKAIAFHRRGGSGTDKRILKRRFQILGRSDELAFHIMKNRFLMILKNESVSGMLWRLPLYLAHDLPRVALLLLIRPGVVWRLIRAGDAYKAAWARRLG